MAEEEKPATPPEKKPIVVAGTIERSAMRYEGIERRRTNRVRAWRPYAGVLFILLGLAIFGGEMYRYWIHDIPLSGSVAFLGACLAFVGFYMLNHEDTINGGKFIVNNFVTLIQAIPSGIGTAIRGGRRSTDAPVQPPEEQKK
jgi:hypothetical protein